jgi:hypothetical protein
MEISSKSIFVHHIALPQDHGSWVFLLSPLLIGLFAAKSWSPGRAFLILAAFAAFLIRQPVTVATKVYSGRRSRRDLPAAYFWISVYTLVGLGALAGLIAQGFAYLLYLAIPGLPVFAWHLYLVSRRSERKQIGIEIVGSGVLALASPAAFWVGVQRPDPTGWLLFGLTWLQSAASIVYAYLRLEQRGLAEKPDPMTALRMGRRALAYTTFNLLATTVMAITQLVPPLLPAPYALQWLETIWGTLRPAVGFKPTRIGIRQLIVSTIFTVLFIVAWNLAL